MVKEINNSGSYEKKQNMFSRFYNHLEDKYSTFSNWLTEKGIPLNNLNSYLEEKGLPAFAIVASVLLLLLFIIAFLIVFSFSNQAALSFSIKDYSGLSIDNAYLKISSSKKDVFSGTVNDNEIKKLKLKLGETYSFSITKEGYPDYLKNISVLDKNQKINILFSESVEYGILKIKLIDRDNNKQISSGTAIARYTVNNSPESKENIVDMANGHIITLEVPINKDLDLLVSADGYEDFKETNYRITLPSQEKIIEMDVSSISFEGKSNLTFVVLDKEQNPIDGALIKLYNAGEEEIFSLTTINGKALAYVDSGSTISYRVEKEGYRTFISDTNISIRVLKSEMSFNVVLEEGGNFLNVFTKSKSNFLLLPDVSISVYDLNQNTLNSGNTDQVGEIKFTGLSDNQPIIVTACREHFLCEYKKVDLSKESSIEFTLEEINVTNSATLSIFVVDEKNMPISKAFIKIYTLLDELEIPYNTSLQTDLTGSLSLPLRIGENYRVYSMVGEVEYFEEIKINALKENKIIFIMDNATKLIKLDLYDENGIKLTSGKATVKTKDGTVLFDGNLSQTEGIIFSTEGYKDLFVEYTDVNGNRSSANFSADQSDSDGYIRIDFKKEVNLTDSPVIEFSGIVDAKGKKSNYVTVGEEYFLIFDVLFPENTYKGEVHIRAGEDSQTDVEEMSYGISGFSAMDVFNFKYGTTYNSEPLPGMMSVDLLNEGSSQVLNKWLELKWNSDVPLGNKQFKIKINVTDDSYSKLTFKYRSLFEKNKIYYRDPVDETLKQSYSSSQKGGLYAETKQVVIDLFNVPLECKGESCVSYTFIDQTGNEFSKEDFYAIKGNQYFLKVGVYSLNNKKIDLFAETSKTFPLISFGSFSDSLYQNEIINDLSLFELSREGITVSQNTLKNIYLSFISTEIGSSYIDLKGTDVILGNEVLNDRVSFNVYDEKEMSVLISPSNNVDYGTNFTAQVLDSISLEPITDAFISFYDERGSFISSLKQNNTNGRNGIYTIENNFNQAVVYMKVEKYGYLPSEEILYVIDNSLLTAVPSELVISLGLDQIASSASFVLENNGDYQANEIRFGEPTWIEGGEGIFLEGRGNPIINKKSSQKYEVLLTTENDLDFTTANATIPIYASIGAREITKIIPVRISKGLMLNECLEITPNEVSSFVGLNISSSYANPFTTPVTSYNYDGHSSSNPLLAPSQNHSNYREYLDSRGYTVNNSTENSYEYTDSENYTYYATSPTVTAQSTENKTYFTIKSNCPQAVTLNPQAVAVSSSSNNPLELSLGDMTILPGEQKSYDVIIKNSSNLKRKSSYSYNILWHNNYYSIQPSVLRVDLLDLSRALWIMPQQINIPITQLHAQQSTENYASFLIKNIGSVPITDIQIGQYPKAVSSNIKITEIPKQIPVLNPGQTVNVDLMFSVNINKSTIDNALIQVTGKAVGVNEPITSTTELIFSISSPNCLKLSNKNANFSLKIGEKRARNITITNDCSEPVMISGIDKRGDGYFETFGKNLLTITPASGNQVIYPGRSNSYKLELTASNLGGAIKMPMIIFGNLMNSGLPVTSQDLSVSVNIEDLIAGDESEKNISLLSSIPVCEDPLDVQTFNRPLVSIGECTESSGYCDGESSANLVLKKVNELSNNIKQFSAQSQSKTMDTGCVREDLMNGYCRISDLGGNVNPIEFSFFMQNDNVTPELVKDLLTKSNYSFKNYFVETNIFNKNRNSALGVYAGGNKIFVSSELSGCGNYTVEIDGYVAASSEYIYPERAYYYINVINKDTNTVHCEKKISNYQNYLPWDLSYNKNKRAGTWLTLFTGDEDLSKALIKGVGKFKSDQVDLRYVYNKDVLSTRNSTLNISSGDILENQEALAKISFDNTKIKTTNEPEQINITLNSKYQSSKGTTSEKVKKDFVNLISSMLSKNDYTAKVCVAKDDSYMLVLDVVSAGELSFKEREVEVPLKDGASCSLLKVRSSIEETLKVSSEQLDSANIGFKKNKDDVLQETINLEVLQNQDANFYFCVTPNSTENISNMVDKKIKVTATSIFSSTGTIGNRSTSAEITLSSCAVTPEDYLLGVYSNLLQEHNKKEEDRILPQNYTALVDWDKAYSPEEKEGLCSTIQKIVDSPNYRGEIFFNYEQLGCDIKDSEQKNTSKLNKGLSNAGNYFFKCAGTCSACYGLSALIIPTNLGGIVIDCLGFSCLVPALDVLASSYTNGEGGISYLFDELFGYLTSQEDFSLFSDISGTIGDWATGVLGVAGSSVSGLLSNKSAQAGLVPAADDVVLTTVAGLDPTTESLFNALDDVADDVVNTSTGTGISSKEFNNLKSQLKNFERYISGKSSDIKFKPSVSDNVRFNDIMSKFSSQRTPIENLSILSSKEVDDFIEIIDKGKLTGKHSHMVEKDLLIKRLKDAKVSNFKPLTSAPAASTISSSATAGKYIDYPVDDFKQFTANLDAEIKQIDDSIAEFEKIKADIETNKNRSTFNAKKAARKASAVEKEIKDLDDMISKNKALKEKYLKVQSKYKGAKLVNGKYKVPIDVADDLTDIFDSTAVISKGASRLSKWKAFGKSFGRGLACGVAGNYYGVEGLKATGKTGLNNSIEFENIVEFEKNVFYIAQVDVLKQRVKDDGEVSANEYRTRYKINIVPYLSQDGDNSLTVPTKRIDSCIIEE